MCVMCFNVLLLSVFVFFMLLSVFSIVLLFHVWCCSVFVFGVAVLSCVVAVCVFYAFLCFMFCCS